METPSQVLRRLFLEARTQNGRLPRPVPESTLRELYRPAHMAPSATNCRPMRPVFLASAEAKERLRPALRAHEGGDVADHQRSRVDR